MFDFENESMKTLWDTNFKNKSMEEMLQFQKLTMETIDILRTRGMLDAAGTMKRQMENILVCYTIKNCYLDGCHSCPHNELYEDVLERLFK